MKKVLRSDGDDITLCHSRWTAGSYGNCKNVNVCYHCMKVGKEDS